MNKKLLFGLALPLLLISCNQNKGNDEGKGKEPDKGIIKEDVTVDFLCMADSAYIDKLQEMIHGFELNEPHVKVNLYNPLGSGFYSMIERTVISGFFDEDYPDLVQCYPDHVVKYLAQGYAVNMDPYLNNEDYGLSKEEKDDYIASFMDEGANYAVEGTYSLPFCKSTELMYYNADALLGIDLSSIDSSINGGNPLNEDYLNTLSWEELFDKLCPALMTYNASLPAGEKIYNPGEFGAILTYDSDENLFITLANQYGYGYTSVDENGIGSVDFNNDGMKSLMKKFKSAKDKGYLQTRKTNEGRYVSDLFQNRQALFMVSSTAGLSYTYNKINPFSIGVGKMPHAEGREYSSINQGPSVCILDHHDETRTLASYLFWKHITNEENASAWAIHTGYMGIRHSSYESKEYIKALEINDDTSLFDAAKARNLRQISIVRESLFNTAVFRGSGNSRTNVGSLVKDCLTSVDLDAEIDGLFEQYAEDAASYLPKN